MAQQDSAAEPARPPRRERRTQAERSARTRERLLDATLACLVERGWAGTTTTEVAERAGVSRGAQLHHFPSRQELVGAALHHLAERRMAEFARAVAALPADSDLIAEGIDLIWEVFSDPTHYALLELMVAARTDAELRATLVPVAERLDARFAEYARLLFPEPVARQRQLLVLRNVTFQLLQGMALTQILRDDPDERAEVLAFLKDLARRTLLSMHKETP